MMARSAVEADTRHVANMTTGQERFVRDGVTAMSYAVFGYYAFYLYVSGPAVALLRSELHFSYTVISLSSTSWAAAAIVAGLSFPRTAQHMPRRALLWRATTGMAVGSLLLATSRGTASVLIAIAVLSFAGTTALMTTQATLADQHGPRRDRALVEANVGAALCAVAAPLLLALLHGTIGSWRVGLVLPMPVVLALYIKYRRVELPASAPHLAATHRSGRPGRPGRLPRRYWLHATLVAGGMAMEMCMVFFSVELVATTTGLATPQATTTLVGFYIGMLVGRVAGSIIARRPGRSVRLLFASLSLAFVGVLQCWLSGHSLLASVGLFIAGIGAANLYPLTLSRALAAAPGQSDAANARAQLLGGSLAIVTPALLGTLADRVGVSTAFAVVPALIVVSAFLLLIGRVAREPQEQAA
jgi:predicted MFS family arabinose efflux permease